MPSPSWQLASIDPVARSPAMGWQDGVDGPKKDGVVLRGSSSSTTIALLQERFRHLERMKQMPGHRRVVVALDHLVDHGPPPAAEGLLHPSLIRAAPSARAAKAAAGVDAPPVQQAAELKAGRYAEVLDVDTSLRL